LQKIGFVLGPRFEENFRRAMLISRGDILVFIKHPISAVFVGLCVLLQQTAHLPLDRQALIKQDYSCPIRATSS
jgi:TctA family transporter